VISYLERKVDHQKNQANPVRLDQSAKIAAKRKTLTGLPCYKTS